MLDLENLSLHEQQALADDERYRQKGVINLGMQSRPKLTDTEIAEETRLSAARALPDELFSNDPEIQRLQANLHIKVAIAEKHAQIRHWLAEQRAQLGAAVDDAERVLMLAMLKDAAAQDASFTQAREAIAAYEQAKSMYAFSDEVHATVAGRSLMDRDARIAARDHAHQALKDRLFELKKAHVDALAQAGQQNEGGV